MDKIDCVIWLLNKIVASERAEACRASLSIQREYYKKRIEKFNTAIEVLRKEVPQKPQFGEYDMWNCPNCNARYNLEVDGNIAYCSSCGQKIDWGEEN